MCPWIVATHWPLGPVHCASQCPSQLLSSDLGYPGTPYANPGCVPCTVESPSVPSRSAPFAAKRVVKRTDSRVRQMGVRIQPQYFPPCDFKLSPQLSALQSPPQHSGGTDASPGVAAGMREKARGPRAPGLARGGAGSCSGTPQDCPAPAGTAGGPGSGPLWRDTFGLGVPALVAAEQIHAGVWGLSHSGEA